MRTTQRFASSRSLLALLLVALLTVSTAPHLATAQEIATRGNSFTSPKYGTEITWTDDWTIDKSQSASEQRRDILVLIASDIDAAVYIELRTWNAFPSAEQMMNAFSERFGSEESFDLVEDNRGDYPPNFTFQQGEDDLTFEAYVQGQLIENALLAAATLAAPADSAGALDLARETIKVDGLPLFEALPICGETTATPATPEAKPGNSKTDGFSSTTKTSQDDSASGECVARPERTGSSSTPVPTPTPTGGGKTTNLNDETYRAPSFDVSFHYDSSQWTVTDDLAAADNNGRDSIQFENSSLGAFLIVESYAGHGGKASACIDLALREAGVSPGSDEVLTDADGNEIVGSMRGRVWGAYAYSYVDTSGESDEELELNAYVECRAMPRAAGVVVVTLIANPGDFLDAYEEMQPILTSIAFG